MTEPLRAQIASLLHRLEHLTNEGVRLRAKLALDPDAYRDRLSFWQRECAATISQLSGGSKAHWLSRAYSDAFLTPRSGRPTTEAKVTEIVDRILAVLAQASASLSHADPDTLASSGEGHSSPVGQFSFVRDADLRGNFQRAFADSQRAYERGDFPLAFLTTCSLLEAIITDALERADRKKLSACTPPGGDVTSWPFEARIDAAEKAGLISAGCARLPVSARRYRELLDQNDQLRPDAVVSDREARIAAQVLRVIVRDLAPGR